MARSPALIFDFGNVIAHFDYGRAAERFGRSLGLSGPEFARRAEQAGFLELLKRYESGLISSQEFHRRVCALTGLTCDFDRFDADWRHIFWANEPVHRLVHGLRGLGYTLVLGSNTNELHARHFREQFADVFRHFDRLVLSYEVGHVKPAAEFYLACAAAAGRPAGECVFIDDLAENVQAADTAGLTGIRYQTTPQLIADLRSLGVEIPASIAI
jgi:putative hydrolase of the HAD superfamily